MNQPLLNAPSDGRVSKQLLDFVIQKERGAEAVLINSVLDRDAYLRAIYTLQTIRAMRTEMSSIYDREFRV